MNYQYVAYTKDNKLVKGKLSADSEDEVTRHLNSLDYKILNLSAFSSQAVNLKKILAFSFSPPVKPKEVIMLSRQLALLIESGIDIVTGLELLKAQTSNRNLKEIFSKIVFDLRGGDSFSTALSKYPKVFSTMYHRTIAAGEQGGNLDIVLKRLAEYMERAGVAAKKIKSALTYPIIVVVLSIVVAAVLVFFILPTFTQLYAQMGATLPTVTKALLSFAEGAQKYGLYVILVLVLGAIFGFLYIKTPSGRPQWDSLLLRLPIIGHIVQLNELSRCCRTMSMLIKVGLPLPEILTLCAQSSGSTVVTKAINEVRQEMLNGEGLYQPMKKRPLFLPLMVQMVAVGEQTGNLGNTLVTAAESYEVEADDKTQAALGLLQPALTITITIVVGFLAVAMVSAMYGIYGQLDVAK